MTAGEQFVKWIKPAGCVLFLGIFAAFLVICFRTVFFRLFVRNGIFDFFHHIIYIFIICEPLTGSF